MDTRYQVVMSRVMLPHQANVAGNVHGINLIRRCICKPWRFIGSNSCSDQFRLVAADFVESQCRASIGKSVEDFAAKVRESQIIFIPGGFSGGDECCFQFQCCKCKLTPAYPHKSYKDQ